MTSAAGESSWESALSPRRRSIRGSRVRPAALAAALCIICVSPLGRADSVGKSSVALAEGSTAARENSDLGAADSEGSDVSDEEVRRRSARHIAQRAMNLMRKERWADAQALLEHAYELVPAPTLAVLEGDALTKMGKLNGAMKRFEAAQRVDLAPDAPPAYRRAVHLAEERLRELKARIPRLLIDVKGARSKRQPLQLWVNDEPLSAELLGIERRVDPGLYVVRAELGEKIVRREVRLQEGTVLRVVLDPSSVKTERHTARERIGDDSGPLPQDVGAWASLGIGGAGLVTGIVAGVVTQRKHDDLESQCKPTCPPELNDEVDSFEAVRTTSWIGYGVGLAGLVTGTLLLLTSSDGASSTNASVTFTPRTAGVIGRF